MLRLPIISVVLFCFLLSFTSEAQTKKEEKMAKKADAHFKKQEFLIAKKFYAQLASTNPKNVEFNYKYGACLLSTSSNKLDAVKYLSFAVKNSREVGEAHYYYAKSLQYSYRFKEALANFNKFRAVITTAKADKLEVDALIKQCRTSIKLIEEFSPVKVVSSKKMKRRQFEKAYRLANMNRRVLIKPGDFKTKEDFTVKKGDPQLIVHGTEQKTLFFSGYKYGGRFAILERDIYMVKKGENGIWSNFLDVGPFINTDFDEDYPYLHPNGHELYFSSKGHGGLGGYDIFKSQLDTITGLWGKPINLGFAINSAFDDILYVVDGSNEVAYFSSNRETSSSEMTVYKILVSDKVDNFVLCKGKVTVEGGEGNKVIIEVLNMRGQLLGEYSSDKKTGDFVFPLAELESYRLRFTYDKTVTKFVKVIMPLKSTKNVVFHNVTFNVQGSPQILSTIDDAYQLSEEEKVNNYQAMASMKINQKNDIEFGVHVNDTVNGIEAITVQDPDLLLADALANLEELKIEKKELVDQINAAYVLTYKHTKNAVKQKQELQKLAMDAEANSPEGKQKVADKQIEYNSAIKDIVDVMLFAESQEKAFFQKDKEEKVATAYVKAINLARSGDDIDMVDYRTKMAASKKELLETDQSKIIEINSEVVALKKERSEAKSEQFKLKSDIALLNDAIEFLTRQMNKTNNIEDRTDFARKITDLEKVKKTKNPLSRKKQIELSAVDSLLNLKEKQLITYANVDIYSAQPSMKRVNIAEREAITANAKNTINKSKYAGKLDQFVVRNVIIGSSQHTTGPDTEFAQGDFSPTDENLSKFFASNLNDANDEQIHQFSKDIIGINNISGGKFEDPQISKNEQLAANNFREALMMRQEIEKKRLLLAETTDEDDRQVLQEEIKILEAHLFQMEFEAMEALSSSNDIRHKEKNSAIELAFLLNPGIQIGEVAQLFDESNDEWDQITMLKQRLVNNSSPEQKSNIYKDILKKQTSVINKLMRIERIIKGEPTDIENTVATTEPNSNTNNADPINLGNNTSKQTNPPVNNYGRNGSKNKQGTTFSGVDISDYGPNSTMRIKKGILLTSDIKYNINTKVPIDIPLGTGVIYKVQIGAFRNKINPEMFNGITPLSGEDAGNGIYRYTAGIFKSLTGANMAKGKIVEIGYSDAFVVAFFNGKRISLTEAEKVIKSSTDSQLQVYQKQKTDELAALKKAGIKESDAYIAKSTRRNPINKFKSLNVPNSSKKGVSSSGATNFANNETTTRSGATRSTNAKGVYYTVQIGVYSTKKTSSDLHGISPLVTHTNERGLIRYSTGIFKSLDQAKARKTEARAQGAEDAYIAVYRDGIRISLEEAQSN